MHSTGPLWQLEERVRNHLKLVSNTILAIMRPGCLILTATILRSSIKASRRQNIVHQGGGTSCWLNNSGSRSSFTPYRTFEFNPRVPLSVFGATITGKGPKPSNSQDVSVLCRCKLVRQSVFSDLTTCFHSKHTNLIVKRRSPRQNVNAGRISFN